MPPTPNHPNAARACSQQRVACKLDFYLELTAKWIVNTLRRNFQSASTLASSIALLLLLSTTVKGIEITRLLVFAEADRARIEGVVSGDTAGVRAVGTIVHAGTGSVLWTGPLGPVEGGKFQTNLIGLKPLLWSPAQPNLYHLEVELLSTTTRLHSKKARFGFRSMEIRNGQFLLNGRPVFLRGVAINPPGRTIPDATAESREFAEAYVKCLKAHNLNIFRISTDVSQTWFDVCDELGMLMYAGRYGSPPGAQEGKREVPIDFNQTIQAYQELFENYVNHPSIIMYYLSNELPVSGKRGQEFSRLLSAAHSALKQWDPTRPMIGNAGYGEGREGDVCDVHRYWGWYYNSFLTYYNLRDSLMPQPLFGDPAKNQPLTFTECVGSFTGSSGEFNVVRSKQLGPRLGWIGHTESPREDALDYQCFMVKQATESFRRMRPLNPRLAGLMPFTILFYNWNGITNFNQMRPKPALAQMAVSYQPVLLSWENWTSHRYAGSTMWAAAHVINDQENGASLDTAKLWWELRGRSGKVVAQGTSKLPAIHYFATHTLPLSIPIPHDVPTGNYVLCGSVQEAGRDLSTNWTDLFIAAKERPDKPSTSAPAIGLYDPSGNTQQAWQKLTGASLKQLDLGATVPALSEIRAIVIGEDAWDHRLSSKAPELRQFVQDGGRVLILKQDPKQFASDWLPSRIEFFVSSPNETDYPPRARPHREQMCVNLLRPLHPVFKGINRHQMRMWSDYTGWNQTKPGFPRIYPVTAGFRLLNLEDLAHTAVLADYDRGLEGVALCEMFLGKGSVILTGFDLCPRAGLDPVSDRLFQNLVTFTGSQAGHEATPLIQQPISWGDLPSEQGSMSGSLNGFLINAEWIPSADYPQTNPLPANTGAWNMMPGDQFVPSGRSPTGFYSYSTASSLRSLDTNTPGTGTFFLRVPEGKTRMLTRARNPGKSEAEVTASIQGSTSTTARKRIAPGARQEFETPLPTGSRQLRISYTGPKDLVIESTVFQ